jgi:hypothetical protein
MKRTVLIAFTLLTFILTACGTAPTTIPSTETSAPPPAPTDTLVPTVELVPTSAPTDTLVPVVTDTPAAATVSFLNNVLPILQSRCVNCHGGQDTKAGLSLATYESLMAGSENGAVIVPGDSANSFLIQQIQNGKMPKRGPKLTPDQLQILISWIMTGALNN